MLDRTRVFRFWNQMGKVNIIMLVGSCIVQVESLQKQFKRHAENSIGLIRMAIVLEVMTDSSTAKEYVAAFNKALRGMSYNDFQQTILLPQNGFTRFIKATNKDRVDLLERITGTGHLAELCLQASGEAQRVS